ncbi:hypothetical protein [Seonamhaeicola maritimus]|uniref:hypothetical protein n=1 Tax=Seonamhaeicola maritimus TaxID=2591822 RepID=UPI002493D36A|nr:hypothetical protein [Seonamhaeicola maritimus]
MKNLIYILLLIIIFSCQNEDLKTELENVYTISAENEKDTLQIESFKILKKRTVDFDFIQNIRINNLKHVIELSRYKIKKLEVKDSLLNRNINNRKRLIELNEKKKVEYLTQIEYDTQRLENTKLEIDKTQNEITIAHQKIVLMRAEFGQNQDKYELIDYVFKGEINGTTRIDTMSILKVSEQNVKFIKDNMFSDYKGI